MQEQTFYVEIKNLTFQTIIGILDFERTTPQKVVLNISFSYQKKTNFIDYAKVASIVENRMKKEKFFLIEDALEDLTDLLYKNFPSIKQLHIEIAKPTILPNCNVSVAIKT